ncbi:hypothetical protein EYC80_002022 [Monilinia laxa]|uniref:MoaB/Mog domain-containing protein n=1 Tax=Monilinia laxa TaxID=61186 RepID=A0A5N6K6Z4_MONLA|nr:hypothetical protein EYC80_002022 [Monilinia laxa]
MFSRFSQLARHLSRPLPNYAHNSAAASTLTNKVMTSSSADERNSRTIHTAACLIIGDEVLGGKTVDNLKRVEVIADDEDEIVEAVRRMSNNYDFVVTSGGIGPTHDDITYQSIGNAFGLKLKLHQEAYERMKRLSKPHPRQPNFNWDEDSPAKKAKLRMVELPLDESRDWSKQVIFPCEDLWVPVACVNGNIHILPGVPRLFEQLLEGLKASLLPRLTDPDGKGICRVLISTPMSESGVAPYLTELAARVEPKGIKVGSYPRWGKAHNTVTLVGRDRERRTQGNIAIKPPLAPSPPIRSRTNDDTPSNKFIQGPGLSAARNNERPFLPTVKSQASSRFQSPPLRGQRGKSYVQSIQYTRQTHSTSILRTAYSTTLVISNLQSQPWCPCVTRAEIQGK